MSAETEKNLREWETNERDVCDDLHAHFTDFGRWEWMDVRDEGLRVYNLMTGEDAEEYSLIDGIIAAVAAQAYRGAIAAVAASLGVDEKYLGLAVAEWSEKQDVPPPPISAEELMRKVADYKVEWETEFPGSRGAGQ